MDAQRNMSGNNTQTSAEKIKKGHEAVTTPIR